MTEVRALENPYKGLKSFEEQDAKFFFGREKPTKQLVSKILEHRFLAILGSSGVGKSSIVHAGLIPKLTNRQTPEGGIWHKVVFKVGQDPMYNLAEALTQLAIVRAKEEVDSARWINVIKVKLKRSENALVKLLTSPDSNLKDHILIVADQFEELLKLQEENAEGFEQASEFFKLLHFAVKQSGSNIHIAIIMRSDFIAQSHNIPHLVELINSSQYLVPKMNREELNSAIITPANIAGATITQSLKSRFLNEIISNDNQLPVLQHALMRIWHFHAKKGDNTILDLPDYEAVGGVKKVLEIHLEEIYHSFDEEKKQITEKLFKAITEKHEGQKPTRSPKEFTKLTSLTSSNEAELQEVVDSFSKEGRSFLTLDYHLGNKDEIMVDLTHESIMSLWSRLSRWIEEEKESVKVYLELCKEAEMYHNGKVQVLSNPLLDTALHWYEKEQPTEVWGSQYDPSFTRAISYLKYSKQEHNFALEYKERKQKKKIKTARRLAILMGSLSIISIMLFIYAIIAKVEVDKEKANAIIERDRAEEQKNRAEELKLIAEEQKSRAEYNAKNAIKQREIADQNRTEAIFAQQKAEQNAQEALRQERIAIENEKEALKQKGIAEEEKANAIMQRQIAEKQREKAEQLKKLADSAKEKADSLRLVSVGRAIAIRSSRLERQKDRNLKGLLANQGFNFNRTYGGYEFDPEIYDALLQANLALEPIAKRVINTGKQISSIVYHSSDKSIIYSTEDGRLLQRRINSNGTFGNIINEFKNCKNKNCVVTKIALLPSEGILVTGHFNGIIKLWNITSGELLNSTSGSFMGSSKIVGLETYDNNMVLGVSESGVLQTFSVTASNLTRKSMNDFLNKVVDVAVTNHDILLLKESGELLDFNLDTQEPTSIAYNIQHVTTNTDGIHVIDVDGKVFTIANMEMTEKSKLSYPLSNPSIFQYSNRFIILKNHEELALYSTQHLKEKPIKIQISESPILHSLLIENSSFVLITTENNKIFSFPTSLNQIAQENCSTISGNLSKKEWEQYIGFDIPYQQTCRGL